MKTERIPWPLEGCYWTGGSPRYFVTPEVLEALHMSDEVNLFSHPDGEFLAGFPTIREKCWFYPVEKKGEHKAMYKAGLTYMVELPETSDGRTLFDLLKLVGARYVSIWT